MGPDLDLSGMPVRRSGAANGASSGFELMGKRPAYMHYAKDWLTDTNLSLCSKAAKGVWQDVLDVMFLNCVCGVACYADGTAWTDEELARVIGGDITENVTRIRELLDKGVAHRNQRDAIYSRRMVADEKERQSNVDRQQRHRNASVTVNVTGDVTQTSGDGTAKPVDVNVGSKKNLDAEEIYEIYPRKIGRRAALKAITSAIFRLKNGSEGPPGVLQSFDDVRSYLIKQTKLFADSPAGQAGEFTPHPATWYDSSRYLDDEREWSRHGNGSQPSKTQQRIANNRAAIVEGLFGKDARPSSQDDGLRVDVGRVGDLGKRALKTAT